MRKESQTSIKDIGGIILIIFVAIVIAFAYYEYRKAQSLHIKINKKTLCPENGPVESTVILIDKTDPLNAVQRAALRNHLEEIRGTIRTNGLLEIYLVGATNTELLQPTFQLCNPGRGAEINELVGNPRLAERRWKESFEEPLKELIDNVLTPEQQASSPILESIQSIAVMSYLNPKNNKVPKRLVIVSDMLQNTEGLSHYKGVVDFETFRNSEYYKRVRVNLDNVDVVIFYVNREVGPGIQGARLIEFWEKYFREQGAALSRVIRLPG